MSQELRACALIMGAMREEWQTCRTLTEDR